MLLLALAGRRRADERWSTWMAIACTRVRTCSCACVSKTAICFVSIIYQYNLFCTCIQRYAHGIMYMKHTCTNTHAHIQNEHERANINTCTLLLKFARPVSCLQLLDLRRRSRWLRLQHDFFRAHRYYVRTYVHVLSLWSHVLSYISWKGHIWFML